MESTASNSKLGDHSVTNSNDLAVTNLGGHTVTDLGSHIIRNLGDSTVSNLGDQTVTHSSSHTEIVVLDGKVGLFSVFTLKKKTALTPSADGSPTQYSIEAVIG